MMIGPPHPYILEEEVSEEVVLYDPEQKMFVALNATAADVWRMSTGEYTMEDMVNRIAGSYGVTVEEIRDQVEATVQELIEAGMLPNPS